MDTGCRLLDTGQVDPDRVECHFPQHDNLEIDIASRTAPLDSGFFNKPFTSALYTIVRRGGANSQEDHRLGASDDTPTPALNSDNHSGPCGRQLEAAESSVTSSSGEATRAQDSLTRITCRTRLCALQRYGDAWITLCPISQAVVRATWFGGSGPTDGDGPVRLAEASSQTGGSNMRCLYLGRQSAMGYDATSTKCGPKHTVASVFFSGSCLLVASLMLVTRREGRFSPLAIPYREGTPRGRDPRPTGNTA